MKIPRDLKPGDRLWYSKTEYATAGFPADLYEDDFIRHESVLWAAACIKAAAEKMLLQLDGLDDAEQFAKFVKAANVHGVKLILAIAVEEPTAPSDPKKDN